MGSPSAIIVVVVIFASLTPTSLGQVAVQRYRAAGEQSGGPTQTSDALIENRPWHVFTRSGDNICAGVIIHQNWVIILEQCGSDAGLNSESNITVHAGGETPESVEQVRGARLYVNSSDDDDDDDQPEGLMVLRLETPLIITKNVQSTRLPLIDDLFDDYKGFATGFYTNGSADIRLKEFSAVVIDAECRDEDVLCARGDADWPTQDAHTRGIDYLEVADYYGDDFEFFCVVGVRKPAAVNSTLIQYYPTYQMKYWFFKHLGLHVKKGGGFPVCTHLVDESDNDVTMEE